MAGPLAGIRVLEFSQVIAAPFAGQILAELGADVIKIEPPEGESWRIQAQFAPLESRSFQTLNRGKASLTLRLDHPESQDIVHALVANMDVVLINYRPDVPAKFRIDYESLKAIKPALIYADLTAFGRRGPWAMRPGYDGVVQAVTGLMAGEAKLRDDGSPVTVGSSAIADYCSGAVLADAIVAALHHRARTGQGQLVECSLFATALNLQGSVIMEHSQADLDRNRLRELRRRLAAEGTRFDELVRLRRSGMSSPADLFCRCWLTVDGAVAIGAESPAEIAAVRGVLETDLPAWGDAGYAPDDAEFVERNRVEARRIGARLAAQTTAHWVRRCVESGVPVAPVRFPAELLGDPQVIENDLLLELVHDVTGPQVGVMPPVTFSDCPLEGFRASPPLGRDTDAVLREVGYSDRQIRELRARGGVVS
jgi:crotonobetainyl-CoA:carnitine CoA-transferase CaiB-like acyl-CoA transferase